MNTGEGAGACEKQNLQHGWTCLLSHFFGQCPHSSDPHFGKLLQVFVKKHRRKDNSSQSLMGHHALGVCVRWDGGVCYTKWEGLNVYQSVFDGKVGDGDTIRFQGRLKCGALRQPERDTSGQWTCLTCGQQRVWPTRPKCST